VRQGEPTPFQIKKISSRGRIGSRVLPRLNSMAVALENFVTQIQQHDTTRHRNLLKVRATRVLSGSKQKRNVPVDKRFPIKDGKHGSTNPAGNNLGLRGLLHSIDVKCRIPTCTQ
jgi:hypothetical protein